MTTERHFLGRPTIEGVGKVESGGSADLERGGGGG